MMDNRSMGQRSFLYFRGKLLEQTRDGNRPLGRAKAIRAYCYLCCNAKWSEVSACAKRHCPLWPYKPGHEELPKPEVLPPFSMDQIRKDLV